MRQLVSGSRYVVVIAVGGCSIAAATLFIFAGLRSVQLAFEAFQSLQTDSKTLKQMELDFILLVDIFLVATVFYIVARGLWGLFIDESAPTLRWLRIRNLDDLKRTLTKVVIVVLGVFFLGEAVTWEGSAVILPLGASIALVIAALTWFLISEGKTSNEEVDRHSE